MPDPSRLLEMESRLEAYKRGQEAIGEALACPPGSRLSFILGAAHSVRKARDELAGRYAGWPTKP